MPRVCVTGGLGFVGSTVCRLLAARGYEVLCLDRLSGAYSPAAGRDALRELRRQRRVEVVVRDLWRTDLDRLLARADGVIHLAALPGVRAGHDRGELWKQNVELTERLARGAARQGARFVLASSSSVYGDARLPMREDAPARPLGEYAASKLAAEQACLAAGGRVAIARLFTVFGPGQRPDMALAAWTRALVRGLPIPWHVHAGGARELTYVDDAARGLAAALERARPGEAYNLAGSGSHRMERVLALLEHELGVAARRERRPASRREPARTAACGRKAEAELGYRPQVELLEGLRAQLASAGLGPDAEGHPSGRKAERGQVEGLHERPVALEPGLLPAT